MDIEIIRVTSRKELNQFINFPKELYRSDRNFVFEPVSMQKEFLSKKNPFFNHSDAEFFIAKSNSKVVGRIASINNTVHNRIYGEKAGFFGFFESIENYEVTKRLLDKVVDKHWQDGFQKIIGPTSFTTNDSCGLLISGFDKPPVIMMSYNKAYYNDFLLRYGFGKEMDLNSYFIDDQYLISQSFRNFISRINYKLTVSGIQIRPINFKILDQEVVQFCEVYNQTNKNNWGFIPLNLEEFNKTAHQFKQFVPDKLILMVEKGPQLIGYIVALPDLNEVFSHMKSGRLFPFGFLKYLWYKKRITNARILILGVLDEYRNQGIDIMLYREITEKLASIGIYHGEACYVMDNNLKMNSIMKKIGGVEVKKYRIYKLEKYASNAEL